MLIDYGILRLPVNSRLLLVKFLGSQKLYVIFDCTRGGVNAPNPSIVQGSTVK